MAAECVVESKRGEGALEGGGGPDLDEASRRERHPSAVRRELAVTYLTLEVEVGDDNPAEYVREEEVALVVDGDEEGAVG